MDNDAKNISAAACPEQVAPSLQQLAGILSPRAYRRAIQLSETDLCPDRWRQFADRVLLALGVASMLAAVVMLVAYNWSSMSRFLKLGLLQGAVIVTTAAAWRAGWQTYAGRLALCASGVLVGPLLALLGQIYQGAASDYRLFLLWALLVLPWAFVARWEPMWLLVGLLLDVAAWRFWQVTYIASWTHYPANDYHLVAASATVMVINAGGWALTVSGRLASWTDELAGWLWQTFALGAQLAAMSAGLVYLGVSSDLRVDLVVVLLAVAVGLLGAQTERRAGHPLIATGFLLLCIALSTFLFSKWVDLSQPDWVVFVSVGVALAVQGGLAAAWLRSGGHTNAG